MKREDDQELWDLLGKTGQPTLSPFFARNVVRQVRQEPGDWRARALGWLRPRRVIPAAAVALVIIATATVSLRPPVLSDQHVPELIAKLDPQDFEVVADLDDLIAMEEDGLWDEETPAL